METKTIAVVNVSKKELNKNGYPNLDEWLKHPNNIYIGRAMSYPNLKVPQSKWANKFKLKIYGRQKCLALYEEYIRNSHLYGDILDLEGKILGCWCHPEPCHGHVLQKLHLEIQKKNNKN